MPILAVLCGCGRRDLELGLEPLGNYVICVQGLGYGIKLKKSRDENPSDSKNDLYVPAKVDYGPTKSELI